MLEAVRLAAPNCPESAIEKHPACAAAISSSGVDTAVPRSPPDPKRMPGVYEFAPLAHRGTVRLENGSCVAANFDSHVTRFLHPERFHAKILVAGLRDSAKHQLDRLRSLRGLALRRHQVAV